ncbi:MAG: TonB-dependent receptor [Proteobacteria bacterium]|nr:TonB-dependent receptor [Pseudomonadota bacterium]
MHTANRHTRPISSTLHTAILAALFGGSVVALPAGAQQTTPAPGGSGQQDSAQSGQTTSPPRPAPSPQASTPAQNNELGTITVQGIRESIQSSIQAKRNASVIEDALSSKDIGDLPAQSIGDALSTITGATAHMEKGSASEIAVRGLGPFLGSAQFNGREVTTGNGQRAVNFIQFPADLINTVAIYKSQRADLVEGGISGTIDMQTIRPLDFGKRRVQFELTGSYPDYDRKYANTAGINPRATFSYVDQYDLRGLGKLGVSVGLQNEWGSSPEEVFSSSSTWTACDGSQTVMNNNCKAASAAQVHAGTPYYLAPSSRTYRTMTERDSRNAQFVSLQWRPNNTLDVDFDFERSHYKYIEDRSDLVLPDALRSIANRQVGDNGALLAYTGSSALESTPDYKVRDESYRGGGLGITWRPAAGWTLSTDYSYSHTVRTETDQTVRLRTNATDINGKTVPGITGGRTGRWVDYSYLYDGDVPSIVLNPAFDVNNWDNFSGAPRVRHDELQRTHAIRALRFDAAYAPEKGFFTALKAGVRLSDTRYHDYDDRVEINPTNTALIRQANLACRQPFPQDDFLSSADGNTITSWATFNSRCLFAALGGINKHNDDLRSPANNDVREKTKAAYVLGEFSTRMFNRNVTGNFGLRYVDTDLTSTGLRSGLRTVRNPDGTVKLQLTGQFDAPSIVRTSDKQWLPSANAALELNDTWLLRVAAYRAMARQDISSLGNGRTFTAPDNQNYTTVAQALQNNVTATGFPHQKPLMSWNGDVSLEWYPDKDSLYSVALYYKRFNGGNMPAVFNETFVVDGQPVVIPVTQLVTTNKSSDLWGMEINAAHRFSGLPHPFDGLGYKLGYNYAYSNFKTQDIRLGDTINPNTGEVTPGIIAPAGIYGLSRQVATASLYYAIGPIDLQAIYRYRTEYYQKFVGAPSQNRYIRPVGTFDFRATWRVNSHLSFSLQAANLTNTPKISDMPIPDSIHEYHAYGRRYYMSIRYRF